MLKRLHRQLKEYAVASWNDKVKAVVQVKDDSRRLDPTLKCSAHTHKGVEKIIVEVVITNETNKVTLFAGI